MCLLLLPLLLVQSTHVRKFNVKLIFIQYFLVSRTCTTGNEFYPESATVQSGDPKWPGIAKIIVWRSDSANYYTGAIISDQWVLVNSNLCGHNRGHYGTFIAIGNSGHTVGNTGVLYTVIESHTHPNNDQKNRED